MEKRLKLTLTHQQAAKSKDPRRQAKQSPTRHSMVGGWVGGAEGPG